MPEARQLAASSLSAQTTGVSSLHCPGGRGLKKVVGGRKITRDGTAIENEQISGYLIVNARNVTIRCVKIIPGDHWYGINCGKTGCPGLVAENVEIVNCRAACALIFGAPGAPAILRRAHLHDTRNDLLKVGPDVIVEYSYLDGFQPDRGTHNDAIQVSGGSNIIFRDNRIMGPFRNQTSAILIKSDFDIVDNVRIERNILSGGTYTLYLRAGKAHPGPSNVLVRDNIWVDGSWFYGPVSKEPELECLTWMDNRTGNHAYKKPANGAPCIARDVSPCRAAGGRCGTDPDD